LYTIKTILLALSETKISMQLNEIGDPSKNRRVTAQRAWLYKINHWYKFVLGSVEAASYWSGIPARHR
jgi:hypothetical protein